MAHGSRLEIGQIETFLAVAGFGGFHRAARALRMSQPAVSARIKALEQSLGVMLYLPEVDTVSLRTDSLILIGHPAHLPRRTHPVSLGEIVEWPLIFFDRGSSDWTITHDLFRRAGLVPNMVLEVEVIETAKKMVE